MSDWIEIRATFASTPADWSPFASCCEANGCPSSMQLDNPTQLLAYLEDTEVSHAIAETIRSELLSLGAESVEISQQPDEDWTEIWKLHFKPMRIGKRFIVCPTWDIVEPEDDELLLLIDPGQAFGTGDHDTTKMCLELLEQYVCHTTSRLLDIGTGSGILSIAAKKLGAHETIGSDIDPIAVEVALENANRNKVQCTFVAAPDLDHDSFSGQFPVVVSNIISATLIRLAPTVSKKVAPQGVWIVSGILASNWPDVLAAAERAGFLLLEQREGGDWVAASLQKL